MSGIALGVDIGGSGIKGGLVDLRQGTLVGDRYKVTTPQPATPEAMASSLAEVVGHFDHVGPVGIGFPAVIVDGVVWTANNIDRSWIGVSAHDVFTRATGRDVRIVNDADAAALCEARFGAARDVDGLVIVLTFGSGIGSGFLFDGSLIANVELGVLEFEGHRPAESHFSAKVRSTEQLSWDEWGARISRYLAHVTAVFTPRLVIVGGGVSRKWDQWSVQIDSSLPVVPAQQANNAGIVGAATLVG